MGKKKPVLRRRKLRKKEKRPKKVLKKANLLKKEKHLRSNFKLCKTATTKKFLIILVTRVTKKILKRTKLPKKGKRPKRTLKKGKRPKRTLKRKFLGILVTKRIVLKKTKLLKIRL